MHSKSASHPPELEAAAQQALARMEALHGELSTGGKERFVAARVQQLRSAPNLHVLEHIAGRILTPIGWDRIDFAETSASALATMLHQAYLAGAASGRQQERDSMRAGPYAGQTHGVTYGGNSHSIIAEPSNSHSIIAEPSNSHSVSEAGGATIGAGAAIGRADGQGQASIRRIQLLAPDEAEELSRIRDATDAGTLYPSRDTFAEMGAAKGAALFPLWQGLVTRGLITQHHDYTSNRGIVRITPSGRAALAEAEPAPPAQEAGTPHPDIARLMGGLRAILQTANDSFTGLGTPGASLNKIRTFADRLLRGLPHDHA